MSRRTLYILWGALYIITAGLGFIPDNGGWLSYALSAVGILFFVPGGVLLYRAVKYRNDRERQRLRRLSLASLGATAVTLMLSMVFAGGSPVAGDIMHVLLGLVSAPMLCCRLWLISLFGWACMLMVSLQKRK